MPTYSQLLFVIGIAITFGFSDKLETENYVFAMDDSWVLTVEEGEASLVKGENNLGIIFSQTKEEQDAIVTSLEASLLAFDATVTDIPQKTVGSYTVSAKDVEMIFIVPIVMRLYIVESDKGFVTITLSYESSDVKEAINAEVEAAIAAMSIGSGAHAARRNRTDVRWHLSGRFMTQLSGPAVRTLQVVDLKGCSYPLSNRQDNTWLFPEQALFILKKGGGILVADGKQVVLGGLGSDQKYR